MKNRNILLGALAIICSVMPAYAESNGASPAKSSNTAKTEITEAALITQRIEKIKNSNKSTLSKEEKKEMRNELHDMQNKIKSPGVGIYISGGTLILIIILLIILL